MIFKMNLNKDNGSVETVEKNFTDKDIKHARYHQFITGDCKDDKAGEYLYIVSDNDGWTLPYYYYKMSDNCKVPCSTGISIDTVIE